MARGDEGQDFLLARDSAASGSRRRRRSWLITCGVNYRDSVAAARDLGNARLLTINQFGHSEALNPDACATGYEVSYLLTGALPPVGAVCQGIPPFPAP